MSRQVKFTKYQGLGNDFVVIDAPSVDDLAERHARAICDRHFGVGADGVLLVTPSERALAAMHVINADGSRPEMCGNGLRCVALHLAAQEGRPSDFHVETDAGLRHCRIEHRAGEVWITISLGRAETYDHIQHRYDERTFSFHRISMGNPHLVTFDALSSLPDIDRFAPLVSAAESRGANVEFVRQLGPAQLQVLVWERGVGRTLACGTGAGAVAVAAAVAGKVPFEHPISVELPGGALEIVVAATDHHVTLTGPARRVYEGQLVPSDLA